MSQEQTKILGPNQERMQIVDSLERIKIPANQFMFLEGQTHDILENDEAILDNPHRLFVIQEENTEDPSELPILTLDLGRLVENATPETILFILTHVSAELTQAYYRWASYEAKAEDFFEQRKGHKPTVNELPTLQNLVPDNKNFYLKREQQISQVKVVKKLLRDLKARNIRNRIPAEKLSEYDELVKEINKSMEESSAEIMKRSAFLKLLTRLGLFRRSKE